MRFAPRTLLPALCFRVGLLAALPVAVVTTTATEARADAKSEARTHFQAGQKFYAAGDYKSAIREFSAAQQLYPADLNNYNLALCYDKLGDPEPAIQYYRAFLDKQPTTDKKTEIEASISRLEAAQARVQAKREAEAKKAEEARRAAEAKKAAEEAKAAEAAAKKAALEAEKQEKARAELERRAAERLVAEQPRPPAEPPADRIPVGPEPRPTIGAGATGTGSTGTPGSAAVVSTGDAQLDRVSEIDINQIRAQRRVGGGPAVDGNAELGAAGGAGATPGVAPQGVQGPQEPSTGGMTPMQSTPEQPKATPVYKKWWFWAIVVVGAYVLYEVAKEPEDPYATARTMGLTGGRTAAPAAGNGGLTLMRW